MAASRFVVPRRRISTVRRERLRLVLDQIYDTYTRADLIHADPVHFPRRFVRVADREVVALLAASLAYGRVAQIARNFEELLHRMGGEPSRFVMESAPAALRAGLKTFRHRWTAGDDIAGLLIGVRRLRETEGSLEAALRARIAPADDSLLPALSAWVKALQGAGPTGRPLLADPARGSACKRLHLFLRWMVRQDPVDPGGWMSIDAALLLTPVDVHMHRVGQGLRFTCCRQAGLRSVLEITGGFRAINASDPVKYDFALTRFGILQSIDTSQLLSGAKGDPDALLQVLLPSADPHAV